MFNICRMQASSASGWLGTPIRTGIVKKEFLRHRSLKGSGSPDAEGKDLLLVVPLSVQFFFSLKRKKG